LLATIMSILNNTTTIHAIVAPHTVKNRAFGSFQVTPSRSVRRSCVIPRRRDQLRESHHRSSPFSWLKRRSPRFRDLTSSTPQTRLPRSRRKSSGDHLWGKHGDISRPRIQMRTCPVGSSRRSVDQRSHERSTSRRGEGIYTWRRQHPLAFLESPFFPSFLIQNHDSNSSRYLYIDQPLPVPTLTFAPFSHPQRNIYPAALAKDRSGTTSSNYLSR
jgi:hypothetical protein